MSCPVNFQALPTGVMEACFTPETVRGRSSTNSLTPLSFPKSRSALWDSSPAGEKLRLQLCSHRKPRLVLLEKALRLAQRHARHSNKPRLHCFFLGSVSVDTDEEGLTLTLDRFDPGRDQAGASDRVPSALLPGDVLVPCVFSMRAETPSDALVQSEAELHHCFKVLQQAVSSRQPLDLSQLIKVRGRVICSQQSDAAAFTLSWSYVCPSVSVDVQPVRAVPIIPTALLRSLTSINRPLPHAVNRQRGFLTMDQTRKLVLLLESDPKASNLPLVGLWLSGVTEVYSPQVWSWCVRFLFSSALQDRVFSESRCFLLLLFTSTHRAPQFYQCRAPGPGPGPQSQLDYQLLTASQCVTLYQVVPVEGQTLWCELAPEDHSRQVEIFRDAQSSFNSSVLAAGRLSVSDQDSGVEDEDLSPRPSPSPHPPAQQARRVQPSVPELSLLMDSSFSSNHSARHDPGSTHRPVPSSNTSSSGPRPAPPPTGNTSSSSGPRPAPPPTGNTSSSSGPRPAPPPTGNTSSSSGPRPAPPPTGNTSSSSGPRPAPPPTGNTSSSSGSRPAPPPTGNTSSSSGSRPAPPPTGNTSSSSGSRPAPPPTGNTSSSSGPRPAPPPHLHSTPNSNLQQPCTCCSPHSYDCTSIFSSPGFHPAAAPPPASSSHHHTPYPASRLHPASPPPPAAHSYHHPSPPSSHPTPPSVPPPSARGAPLSSHHHIPPPFYNHPAPPSHSPNSPPSTLPPPPPCPCSHPPAVPWCVDSPSPYPSHPAAAADPVSPPWFPRPSCVNQHCDQVGGVVPTDTYQLLLHQDKQLRLLQAQVQMLLEAQGKLQSTGQQVDTQTPRSTASIAVGTGASLFWGDPVQPLNKQEEQAPPLSSPRPPSPTPPPTPSSTPSSSSCRPPLHADQPINRPMGRAEGRDITVSPCGQHSVSGLQSPVLGESVSMYRPADDQQNFYHDLMNQLTSRLQESDSRQEVEEGEESRRRSVSVVPDHSHSSSSSSRRKQQQQQQQRCGDPVVSATLRQLQQLGVDVDKEDLTESERRIQQTVESSSTLASINPAAVLSRLSVSEPTASSLFLGGSVDLSLEANAIALRYLSDSQLSRLSLGGHAPCPGPASSNDSLVSPSNMSLATRKYMRRYGLIEEEDEDEEEEEVNAQEALVRLPLTEAQNTKLLPQSQLIRDLRPKMQLIVGGAKLNTANKENCSSGRPSFVRASSRQTEGSVGNILDLSRLRQLPKLF